MGRIDDKRAEVESIEAEIESLRQQLQERRRELVGVRDSVDPDDAARAVALRAVVEELGHRLPVPNWQPGDWGPPLQLALHKARGELADLRRHRYQLAQSIAQAEERAEKLSRLPEVAHALDVIAEIGQASGVWPQGMSSEMVRRARLGAAQEQDNMRNLPNWRERLSELGDDPDYRPPDRGAAQIEAMFRIGRQRIKR